MKAQPQIIDVCYRVCRGKRVLLVLSEIWKLSQMRQLSMGKRYSHLLKQGITGKWVSTNQWDLKAYSLLLKRTGKWGHLAIFEGK